MRGILSSVPPPASVRLLMAGYLLMMVQAMLILQAGAAVARPFRVITAAICLLALAALVGALLGESDPPAREWWRRGRGR